eukprot:UC4_evm2s690
MSQKLQSTRVSSPGKVILHGEHSVVYGKAAIAASLNLRTSVSLTAPESPDAGLLVRVELPNFGITRTWPVTDIEGLVEESNGARPAPPSDAERGAIEAVIKKATGEPVKITQKDGAHTALVAFLFLYSRVCGSRGSTVRVESDLPIGAGLGSSGSYAVSLAAAFLSAAGLLSAPKEMGGKSYKIWDNISLDLINEWAFESEKLVHGRPSGIDNSISTRGAAGRFQSGKLELIEKMPNIEVVIANTKVPRSTKKLVAGVKINRDTVPEVFDKILDTMDSVCNQSQILYESIHNTSVDESKDFYSKLELLIDVNQHLLNSIGVGHAALDQICEIAKKSGFHAKLTGGGGGGCAFTIVPPYATEKDKKDFIGSLEASGFEVLVTSVGTTGVRLE